MKIEIKKKIILGHLGITFTLSLLYLLFKDKIHLIKGYSDIFFVIGISYLIIGLFRITRQLHFYDLLIFGTKKMGEMVANKDYNIASSKYKNINDEDNTYEKSYIEFIIISIIYIMLSIAFCYI